MRNLATALGIAIGLVGLLIDFWQIVPNSLTVSATNPVARSLPDSLIWFFTYFTHLSNLGLVLVYVAVLSGWRGLSWLATPRWMALMGGYILLVMIYYHVALSGLYTFEGPMLVSTITLHYVAPVYYLLWWGLFAPHGRLRFTEIGWMLVPGLTYVAWALVRGAVVGEYPYDILDAGKFGYLTVAIGVAALLLAVTVFCTLMVAADKLLGRIDKRGS